MIRYLYCVFISLPNLGWEAVRKSKRFQAERVAQNSLALLIAFVKDIPSVPSLRVRLGLDLLAEGIHKLAPLTSKQASDHVSQELPSSAVRLRQV